MDKMTSEQFWARGAEIEEEHIQRLNALQRAKHLPGDIWAAQWRDSFVTRDAQEQELTTTFYAQL